MHRTPHGRSKTLATMALALALGAGGRAIAGDPARPDPGHAPILHRIRPAGGWHPDGGGLLHWWDPHCFPRVCGPDDYGRKPPPCVCWPPYPPYYIIAGSPETCPR